MKNRNLKYQFLQAINYFFKEKQDKHNDKKNGIRNTEKIYSYAARTNLINLSAEFSNYMKQVHSDVKLVKDVNSNHVQEFLNSKTESCSQKTLEQYQSQFRKLEKVVVGKYGYSVDYQAVVPLSVKNGGGKIRNQMLEDKDFDMLVGSCTNQNLIKGILLSRYFGLRASECTKLKLSDCEEKEIHIVDSKGKRNRTIYICNQNQRDTIQYIFSHTQGNRICDCQTESLQQAFRRELKKTGLSEKYKNGAFHLCRKTFITEQYQNFREEGETVQVSLDKCSCILGHNKNRNKLMKEYICCPIV